MKVCLFLTLVLAVLGLNAHTVHLTDTQKEKANQHIADCVKETGVKTEFIEEAKKGHYSEDEGMKKFVLCFFNKAGILSSDAKLNIDVALSKLHPSVDKTEAKRVLEECKNKTGKDAVETAFNIFKCYHEGTKTHVLF